MAEHRYYWLKLRDDFFTSKRIKKLRRIAGGDTYTIIYLKLQLLAMKSDGVLEYTGLEPSFVEELALDLDESIDDIRVTMNYLLSCGLAETSDERQFFFPYSVENTGSEGSSAKRMREMRERKKLTESSHCDNDVTQPLRERYGEKDIDIDKDIYAQNDQAFEQFWSEYPKKKAKQNARKAFAKAIKSVSLETLLESVKRQKETEDWITENGKYIPYPATWLNGGCWEDDLEEQKPAGRWVEDEVDEYGECVRGHYEG